ncbi:hypothetical protein H4S01_000647 [Coemansia sp. RSA 2610]|nr:hypothetical protein H4S01_000647 [Coemansia sp. RSA 2610]
MDVLGMRLGATEIAAHVFALQRLGMHTQAIDRWREGLHRCYGDIGSATGARADKIRHMFPQTHMYALEAAIALRNARVVGDIYRQAIHAMTASRELDPKSLKRVSAALPHLFWSVFPVRAQQALINTRGPKAAVFSIESSADRAWDPARLGSALLASLYRDACEWASSDRRLLSRIMQFLLRALFSEGHRSRAMDLYIYLLHGAAGSDSGRLVKAQMTPEILCEVVSGLCRHSQLDEAYATLMDAGREHRSIYVWNAYFDGLANAAFSSSLGSERALERLRQAMRRMETADGVEPDIATRSIWLRACFRFGSWEAGEKYFCSNHAGMQLDVVCWDTVIRGQLTSPDPVAQKVGWQLVDELVKRVEAGTLAADARLLETVLQHILRHLYSHFAPAYAPNTDVVRRIFAWLAASLPQARHNTFAVVIGWLLAAGRMDDALELHETMRHCALWPSKSLNCMVVRAIAQQNAAQSVEFIEGRLPRQHFNAAYFAVLKLAVQRRDYDEAWCIIDRHYPEISAAATADSPEYSAPFPDATMYSTALRLTSENGDHRQHRLLLDRMQAHLAVVTDRLPLAAGRIARVYGFYRNRQQIL